MKIAIACWNDRVAPIFDNARQVHLAECESGQIVSEQTILLQENAPLRNAALLSENGVDTLVCGAISRPVHTMVAEHGIRVIPFLTGSLQEILQACLKQQPLEALFAMPGCCGRRRHGRGLERCMGMGGGKGFGQGRALWNTNATDPAPPTTAGQPGMGKGRALGFGGGMGSGRGGGAGRGMGTGNGRGGRRGGNNF